MRIVAGMMVSLAFCLVASPVAAAPSLAGTWFGQGQPGDKASMYLDHFMADGRLHSKFRDCRNGKAVNNEEDGTWSISGKLLIIQVNFHNGALAPRTDVYALDAVTAREFRITFLLLKFPYAERRVDDKFEMPSCQLVS